MPTQKEMIPLSDIKVIFFDLDNTLYPHDNGLWEIIRERIDRFMVEELHFPPEQVPGLRHRLWKQYGTTLRGLQAEYQVNMDAYLSYVHTLPLKDILTPDPALPRLLAALPQPKFIFTNSDAAHARRVLNALDIADHFQAIIDIYAVAPHCKPQPEAFKKALDQVGQRPGNCLLIDDSPTNLSAAQHLGIRTVSVGARQHAGSPHFPNLSAFLSLSENGFEYNV